jgi:predicted metal-dependent hydrolase
VKIDQLIRSRRKTIALIVTPEGKLVVRAPLRATKVQIQAALDRHAVWIQSKQQEALQLQAQHLPKRYQEGEKFWYLGEQYTLQITASASKPLSFSSGFILARQSLPAAGTIFTEWYRQQARQVIGERVKRYAQQYGYRVERIRFGSARTRWGSCSSRGTLSFTWRLVMAPLPVIDYVILHELAHLEHPNHSPAFWGRVKQLVPDYKQQIAWLKQYGPQLKLPD